MLTRYQGLKSKNAKQRAECLIEMEFLVTTHGMSVCQAQVQPAKVMKAVAPQVGDRDNGVRSAALDFVVCVHVVIGDDVFKLMGPIPDMCTDLITERIKRTGKKPDAAAAGPASGAAAAAPAVASAFLKRSNFLVLLFVTDVLCLHALKPLGYTVDMILWNAPST
jgi:cytoskeleton-associated protein 5